MVEQGRAVGGFLIATPDILVASRVAGLIERRDADVRFVMSAEDLLVAVRGYDGLVLVDTALLSGRHDILADLEASTTRIRWISSRVADAILDTLRVSNVALRLPGRPRRKLLVALREDVMRLAVHLTAPTPEWACT